MSDWSDRYLRHYTRFFGKPFDVQTYRGDEGLSLRLGTYDLRYRGFRVYASIGLADLAAGERGEAILLSDDFGKDIIELFVHSLFFIVQNQIPLGSGFAVGGIDRLHPDFAEQYGKIAIYYTDATGFDPGFDQVIMGNDIGRVFQGLFISWAELDLLNRKGPDEFDKVLLAQTAELNSLKRPSCV